MDLHRHQFLLRPDITFLNFGSFGACPREIYHVWQKFQLELEEEPVQFIVNRGPIYLQKSRMALGTYVGCDADDLVYIPNPTYGINAVVKSLNLGPDDEVLTTDLEYGAMDRTFHFYSKKCGFQYVRQHIPLPITDEATFEEAFWKGLTPKTKAIFISHITSSTALILPIKNICTKARSLGLTIIVDGAHVPAHIPLNLGELEVDYYTGACHKWMMTPKGSSFLYVRRELQKSLDPLIVSWGYESAAPSHSLFLDHNQFTGTRDFSAYLTIPAAIDFMTKNNWNQERAACKSMIREQAPRFSDLLQGNLLAPLNEKWFGQMCSVPIRTASPDGLKQVLYEKYKIEIPVMVHGSNTYLRFSAQAFNTSQDYDVLFEALSDIIATDKKLLTNAS